MADHASLAVKKAKLTYDPRSWLRTFRMLDVRRKPLFVLLPWFLFTLLAIGLSVVSHYYPECRDYLEEMPAAVSTLALGSTMSLLLAFRLNSAYSRWSEARSLWGQVIHGSRSLLTQIVATAAANPTCTADELQRPTDCSAAAAARWLIGCRCGALAGGTSLSQLASACARIELPRLADDPGSLRRMHAHNEQVGGWAIAFAVALKRHLRGEGLPVRPAPNQHSMRAKSARRRGAPPPPRTVQYEINAGAREAVPPFRSVESCRPSRLRRPRPCRPSALRLALALARTPKPTVPRRAFCGRVQASTTRCTSCSLRHSSPTSPARPTRRSMR